MKKLVIIVAVVATAFSSCGVGGGSIKTDLDSVAYAIGVDIGNVLKMRDSTMNPNLVAKGIIDVFKGKNEMDRDSALMIQREYFMVKLPAKALAASEEFLASVEKENPNIQKTESGLLYEVIVPGDTEVMPTDDKDKVKVKYTGYLKDGKEFDSSKEDTIEFALNRVIKGWGEGLKLVGQGGTIKLWIPADIAYGQHGSGPIGPNEALVFDVELIEVTPFEAPEEGK